MSKLTITTQHNVPINHRARQISSSDFSKFAYILAADESNLRHLQGLERRLRERESSDYADNTAEVKLWGSYLPGNRPIADPYYDNEVSHLLCGIMPSKSTDSAGWF